MCCTPWSMRARTIIAAPVIWFGSWLFSLMVFVLVVRLACFCFGEIKKGPKRPPCAPSEFGWQSATPGGAPGYDGNKEFGNNIAHRRALTSQRLREHSDQARKVKASRSPNAIWTA